MNTWQIWSLPEPARATMRQYTADLSAHAGVPRILLVRLSSLGDVLHALPVLNALRAHFPHGEISWLVERPFAELLVGHPALDRLLIIPKKWWKSPACIQRLCLNLRALAPEVTIDLQCLAKSAGAARASGAPVRIGFDGPDGREFSRFLHNTLVLPTATHVIDRNLELLRPLGIDHAEVEFDLPYDKCAEKKIDGYMHEHNLAGKDFAIINPGAGWPSRRWEIQRFADVAHYLGERFALPSVVVWAGPFERHWAKCIVAASGEFAVPAPATGLRELTALARRACLFVSADTGPLHIAAAVGTPCVGLYGPIPAARNGPYGSQHIALQKVQDGGTRYHRHCTNNDAMLAISTDDVIDACETILRRQFRLVAPGLRRPTSRPLAA